MHLGSLGKSFLLQRRRNLPPALLAMSSPRLEPRHRPKELFDG
jgi:hypothetical protein